MTDAEPVAIPRDHAAQKAEIHAVLRFAAGTTAALVVCEAMGWNPTFLAPLLAGTLLASLPADLPVRAGLLLVLIQAFGAYSAFALTALLGDTPIVLFGVIALAVFACFGVAAQGRAVLPVTLVLIAFATVPVVTMIAPQQAGPLPWAFVRAMAVAVLSIWTVQSLWTQRRPPQAQPKGEQPSSPLMLALAGCVIVLPMMLMYLMYGITDALPLLITTVLLVLNFDPRRGRAQATAMVFGALLGGVTALLALGIIDTARSLATLVLVTLLVGLVFGSRIARGGPGGAVSLITYNQALVIFGLGLAPGGAAPGLWLLRVLQFVAAALFAVGLMTLLLPRPSSRAAEAG